MRYLKYEYTKSAHTYPHHCTICLAQTHLLDARDEAGEEDLPRMAVEAKSVLWPIYDGLQHI